MAPELDRADPERGAMAPPDEPESHVDEDESEPDDEPELLCAEVESEVESDKMSESLADDSDAADFEVELEEYEEDSDTAELELVLADESVDVVAADAVLALAEDAVDEEEEFVAVDALETLEMATEARIST